MDGMKPSSVWSEAVEDEQASACSQWGISTIAPVVPPRIVQPDDASSVGSGGGVIFGRPTQVLIVPDGNDATALINSTLQIFGAGGGGHLYVQRENILTPVYVNGIIQINHNNVDLEFGGIVNYGPLGSIRIRGQKGEFWRGANGINTGPIPAVSEDATVDDSGRLVLTLRPGEGAQFIVGDFIVIRGLRDLATGATIHRQYSEVISIVGDVLTCEDLPAHTFLYDYGQPSLDGTGFNTTNIRVMRSSAMTVNTTIGQKGIVVEDTSYFAVGDLCYIDDQRREVDMNPDRAFNNLANMEILRLVGIDADTDTLTFENGIRRIYDTSWNARVTKLDPVSNSSIHIAHARWVGIQTSRVVAVQTDYGAHCKIRVDEIEGNAGRIGQGIRLSYSYDCHASESYIWGAYSSGSGEAYGATMYYSTGCSISNMRISGQRHSILMQTTTVCKVYGIESTDELITAIDTHGTACVGDIIENNRIIGGSRYAVDVTLKCGIRVGNSSHVIPDRDTIVRNNVISGFSEVGGSALDIVGPSMDATFEKNVIIDCDVGFRRQGNNSLAARIQNVNRVLLQENTFIRVNKPVEVTSDDNGTVSKVELIDNTTIDCPNQFKLTGVGSLIAIGNRVLSPETTADIPMFDLIDIDVLYLNDNFANNLEIGARVRDCPNAKIIGNNFERTTTQVDDISGNTNPLFRANSGGLSDSVTLTKVDSAIVGVLDITDEIPHNNSEPDIADGGSVMTTTLTTIVGEIVEVEAVIPYVEVIGSSGPVTAHIFVGSVAIASTTTRVTVGGSSGTFIRLTGSIIASGTSTVISLRLGPSSGITARLNSKFDGLSNPYFLIRRLKV